MLQSQPLSLIMWDNSIINFPSLYFWLNSNACSCRGKERRKRGKKKMTRLQGNDINKDILLKKKKKSVSYYILIKTKHAYIFPAQCGVAILAVNISHSMKTGQQQPFFCWATTHIHPEITKWQFNQLFLQSQCDSSSEIFFPEVKLTQNWTGRHVLDCLEMTENRQTRESLMQTALQFTNLAVNVPQKSHKGLSP